MILLEDFEVVSMTVCGEPISGVPVASTAYMDHARCLCYSLCLHSALYLVTRLIFCLKPPNDGLGLSEFSYFYSDLHEEDIDLGLIRRTTV